MLEGEEFCGPADWGLCGRAFACAWRSVLQWCAIPHPPAAPLLLTQQVDACLVATGRAPYTNGLNLPSLGVATDRRGFVPVNDKMEVGGGYGWVGAERGREELQAASPSSHCIH